MMNGLLTTQDLIIIGIAFAVLVLFVLVGKKLTKGKRKDALEAQKKIKTLEKIYAILLKNKLTKNYIIRATKKYGELSVYSPSEIKCIIIRDLFKTTIALMVALVGAAFAFKEAFAIGLCLYGVFVFFNVNADKNIEKGTVGVYKEMKIFLSSLRIEFKKSKGDILVALENATCGPRIAGAIDKIKQVLVSPDPEGNLERFYQDTPFKQIQTLATVCYNIYAHGDIAIGKDNSVFDEAMLLMEADVNQKLEIISFEKNLYSTGFPIDYLPFAGIALAIAMKLIMMKIMPATSTFYNNIVGLLIQDGTIFYSIFTFNQVSRAHLQQVILPDDRMGLAVKLSRRPLFRDFIRTIVPREQKLRILNYQLKLSSSKHDVYTFTAERCTLAALIFAVVACLTFTVPTIERTFLEGYTQSFDMLADNSAFEDKDGNTIYTKEEILEMDNEYLECRRSGIWDVMDEYDEADIKKLLLSYVPTLTTLQMEDQMSRLEVKYEKLNAVKYHWWYILFALAGGVVGFIYPKKKLQKRLELAIQAEEEEFLQLQMVTLILSALNMDTLDTLKHLANISEFHKRELTQCCYGYVSDPEGALQQLEDSIKSPNFKLFVGKLKETIENLSVQEVFADLRNDRVHICNERDAYLKSVINHRRAKMGQSALRPMQCAIYGMMVVPLAYTGISNLVSTMDSLTEMSE